MKATAAFLSGASQTTKTDRSGSTAKENFALFWQAMVR